MSDLFIEMQAKLKALDENLWDRRANWPHVERWLNQFKTDCPKNGDEKIQMLFLATHFIYFGMKEIRGLLRSLYRDIYQHAALTIIRKRHSGTTDLKVLSDQFELYLRQTRFLGMGNPSESGCHLLYYFRQENRLSKQSFINSHEIFSRTARSSGSKPILRFPEVRHYVFIDDLCGSGTQAIQYGEDIVRDIKAANRLIKVSYYPLFATSTGINNVRRTKLFNDVLPVVELDKSFRVFSAGSRIFKNEEAPVNKNLAERIATKYGHELWPSHPLGYKQGQLLIGFAHNTPDNTLPIIWFDEPDGPKWTPLFRRFPKQYDWSS